MTSLSLERVRPLLVSYGVYLAGLITRGVELVGKLGLYMLAARVLGAHDAGLFFLCITWVSLIATVARTGFEKASTRHIAAELAVGDGRAALRAMIFSMIWASAGGLIAAAITYAAAEPISVHLFSEPDLVRALALSAIVIVPQNLCIMFGHALAGLKRGIASQLVQNALWPVLTLSALALGVHQLDGLLYALAGSMMLASLLGLVLVLRRWRVFSVRRAIGAGIALPPLWKTALPLAVVEINQIALSSIPVLVLGMFASAADVGAFSVAMRISLLIWVVIISIGTIAAPMFAEHHRLGELRELHKLNRNVWLAISAFGVPVVAIMMLFPSSLLSLIGPGFETAATALVIMAVGQLVNCLLPCQDILLAMTGHGARLRLLNLLQFASCVVFSALLIPSFGMIGAATTSAICIAQGAIGTALSVRSLLPRPREGDQPDQVRGASMTAHRETGS